MQSGQLWAQLSRTTSGSSSARLAVSDAALVVSLGCPVAVVGFAGVSDAAGEKTPVVADEIAECVDICVEGGGRGRE